MSLTGRPEGPGAPATAPAKPHVGCVPVGLAIALFLVSLAAGALGYRVISDVAGDRDNLGGFFGIVFGGIAAAMGLGASLLFFHIGRTHRVVRWLSWLPLCAPAADLIAWTIYR